MNVTDDLGPDRSAVPISARDQMAFEFAKILLVRPYTSLPSADDPFHVGRTWAQWLASDAYALADALLAARETKA